MNNPSDTLPGAIGRYKIVSLLGKGGFGTVYKAFDPVLERDVAIKVVQLASMGLEGEQLEQKTKCLKEARLAAQFIHPNIAITYDAGFESASFFMAMECVEGKGLHAHATQNTLLPRQQVLEAIYNTCYALEYIHEKGYVHLDVKPSNIMLTQSGEIKVMDFGISRLLKEGPRDKETISGSLFYMSPEQTRPGSDLDGRTDIYSLGVAAYQLLSGRLPFDGDNTYKVLYQIVHNEPPRLTDMAPEISPELADVIQRAMAKEADERFVTAKAFAEALLPIIKGKDSAALNQQEKKKIEYMRRMLFFKHFQPDELQEVLRLSAWGFYPENTWILEESETDRNIYILILGRATIHLNNEKKPMLPGDCLGESAVLHGMPRNARLKADRDCVVMAINANVLNQADAALQLKFLRAFYLKKTLQLVDANLKLIQLGL